MTTRSKIGFLITAATGAAAAWALHPDAASETTLWAATMVAGTIYVSDIANWARTEGRSRTLRWYATSIQALFGIGAIACIIRLAIELRTS